MLPRLSWALMREEIALGWCSVTVCRMLRRVQISSLVAAQWSGVSPSGSRSVTSTPFQRRVCASLQFLYLVTRRKTCEGVVSWLSSFVVGPCAIVIRLSRKEADSEGVIGILVVDLYG